MNENNFEDRNELMDCTAADENFSESISLDHSTTEIQTDLENLILAEARVAIENREKVQIEKITSKINDLTSRFLSKIFIFNSIPFPQTIF